MFCAEFNVQSSISNSSDFCSFLNYQIAPSDSISILVRLNMNFSNINLPLNSTIHFGALYFRNSSDMVNQSVLLKATLEKRCPLSFSLEEIKVSMGTEKVCGFLLEYINLSPKLLLSQIQVAETFLCICMLMMLH